MPSGWALLFLLFSLLTPGQAAVRFDAFLGYDGVLPDASWFPIVCEVQNDGPAFNALVEVTASRYQSGQRRFMRVELPTGTTKRFVIPMFSDSRYAATFDARLLDERDRVRAEQAGLRVRSLNAARVPLIAAVARTIPALPEIKARGQGWQLTVARLQPAVFPDNPIALDGIDVLYLSSGKALDLKVSQVNALLAWVRGGGRLVVGVEQLVHLNGCDWLRRLLPVEVTGLSTLAPHSGLQEWLTSSLRDDRLLPPLGRTAPAYPAARQGRIVMQPAPTLSANPYVNLKPDPDFESQPLQVATCTLTEGTAVAGSQSQPLMVNARRGRGEVLALLFSPELEPFASWKNRSFFWARVTDLPPELLSVSDVPPAYGGSSTDGVFGAMIDSRQVRKLPIGWLLVLLLAYLGVIGPLDRWWLKKINRPMWTWLTFPAYVAFFSVLIYSIGYKLRAGEVEYNELHVVDLIPAGEQADWRGQTYASLYSPVNARYPVASDLPFATLRGEFAGSPGGSPDATRASVEQRGNNFQAELSVPVWTSQLFVGDWWRRAELPLSVTLTDQGTDWDVSVNNRTDTVFSNAKLVIKGRVVEVGSLAAHKVTRLAVKKGQGIDLATFVQSFLGSFERATQQRNRAFSTGEGAFIDNPGEAAMAVSFIGLAQPQQGYSRFIAPAGLDLTPQVEQGDAVLLAWAPNWTPVSPMNRFRPKRSHRDTLLRIAVDMNPVNVEAANR